MKRRDFLKVSLISLTSPEVLAGGKKTLLKENSLISLATAYIPEKELKKMDREELIKQFEKFTASLNRIQKVLLKTSLYFLNFRAFLWKGRTFSKLSQREKVILLESLYKSRSSLNRKILEFVRVFSFVSLYSTKWGDNITGFKKPC